MRAVTLRITKRMLLFNSSFKVQLPEVLGSSAEQLLKSLTELVIDSVIRPRVVVASFRRPVRQADLDDLLKSTATCDSPMDLAKILRQCPNTKALVVIEENASACGQCSSCGQLLQTKVAVVPQRNVHSDLEEDEVTASTSTVRFAQIHHLTEPDERSVEPLFADHQKFLFLFERITEFYIQQRRNKPNDISEFLHHLIDNSRLYVSWRFLIVIVRCILST